MEYETSHLSHCYRSGQPQGLQGPSNNNSPIPLTAALSLSRPLSTSDGDDANARATDDYAPADAAANVVDEDAPAPLLTLKQRGISKKAPPLSEKQKKGRRTMGGLCRIHGPPADAGVEDVRRARRPPRRTQRTRPPGRRTPRGWGCWRDADAGPDDDGGATYGWPLTATRRGPRGYGGARVRVAARGGGRRRPSRRPRPRTNSFSQLFHSHRRAAEKFDRCARARTCGLARPSPASAPPRALGRPVAPSRGPCSSAAPPPQQRNDGRRRRGVDEGLTEEREGGRHWRRARRDGRAAGRAGESPGRAHFHLRRPHLCGRREEGGLVGEDGPGLWRQGAAGRLRREPQGIGICEPLRDALRPGRRQA